MKDTEQYACNNCDYIGSHKDLIDHVLATGMKHSVCKTKPQLPKEVEREVGKIAGMVWQINLHSNTEELDLIESEIKSKITRLLSTLSQTHQAEMREAVEAERERIKDVLSRSGGYYLTEDMDGVELVRKDMILQSLTPEQERKHQND